MKKARFWDDAQSWLLIQVAMATLHAFLAKYVANSVFIALSIASALLTVFCVYKFVTLKHRKDSKRQKVSRVLLSLLATVILAMAGVTIFFQVTGNLAEITHISVIGYSDLGIPFLILGMLTALLLSSVTLFLSQGGVLFMFLDNLFDWIGRKSQKRVINTQK